MTAYDGDRIMGVFIGKAKNTTAARTALKINYCARQIIKPLLKEQYPENTYDLRHVVGVDVSSIRAARTGARGANDLVWVGRAANYAAKLTELSSDYPTWITADVYDNLNESAKVTDGRPMWEARTWNGMSSMLIYCSNWWWPVG